MTDDEFEIITPGTLQTLPGFNPATEVADTEGANDRSNRTPFSKAARDQNTNTGPVMGVRSRSTETSMMEFDGLDSYEDWIFTPSAPGLLGGHTEPQTTLSGGVGPPNPGQPGGVSPPGSALPGAFGAHERGLAPPARGENDTTPGRGSTASPVGLGSGDLGRP